MFWSYLWIRQELKFWSPNPIACIAKPNHYGRIQVAEKLFDTRGINIFPHNVFMYTCCSWTFEEFMLSNKVICHFSHSEGGGCPLNFFWGLGKLLFYLLSNLISHQLFSSEILKGLPYEHVSEARWWLYIVDLNWFSKGCITSSHFHIYRTLLTSKTNQHVLYMGKDIPIIINGTISSNSWTLSRMRV